MSPHMERLRQFFKPSERREVVPSSTPDRSLKKVRDKYPFELADLLRRIGKSSIRSDHKEIMEGLAEEAYPVLLKIYQKGIEDYRSLAERKKIPFEGDISGSMDSVVDGALIMSRKDSASIIGNGFLFSSIRRGAWVGSGLAREEKVEIIGPNELEVTEARYSCNRYNGEEKQEIISLVIKFQNNLPKSVCFVQNPDPIEDEEVNVAMKFTLKFG